MKTVRLGPYTGLGFAFTIEMPRADRLTEVVAATFAGLRAEGEVPRTAFAAHPAPDLPGQQWRILVDGECQAVVSDRSIALDYLTWSVNQGTIRVGSAAYTLVHAAAVSREGGAVVLAAPMESGKSTTCAGLLRRGWSYLTDEAVAVDEEGLLTPFPKAVTIDPGAQFLFPELARPALADYPTKWHVPAGEFPAAIASGRVRVSALLFPQYQADAETKLIPVTRAEAVTGLARSTFNFLDAPERNVRRLAALSRRARSARLVIGSLEQAVERIECLVESGVL